MLTATAALGRWEEFRLHVRTGLAHELEPCDLQEVLLQVAVYAGVPAANAAFHIAAEDARREARLIFQRSSQPDGAASLVYDCHSAICDRRN